METGDVGMPKVKEVPIGWLAVTVSIGLALMVGFHSRSMGLTTHQSFSNGLAGGLSGFAMWWAWYLGCRLPNGLASVGIGAIGTLTSDQSFFELILPKLAVLVPVFYCMGLFDRFRSRSRLKRMAPIIEPGPRSGEGPAE